MSLGRWSTLLGLVGFVVGAWGSGRPSFWYDEAVTVFGATRSAPDLLRELDLQDAPHATYYLGMHLWFSVFGSSEFSARLPSAIAVGVATAGVVVLGARLADVRTGVWAALLFAILPRITWAATEAREYGLNAACAVWLTALLVIAIERRRAGWWVGYCLCAVLCVAVFFPSSVLVVAHGVTLLLRREPLVVLHCWAAAAVAAAAGSLPLVVISYRQRGQADWIPAVGWHALRAVFEHQWFVGAPAFAVLLGGVLIAGIVADRRLLLGPVAQVALPWAVLPTVALLGFSLLASPLYVDRYLTYTAPAVALLGGAALATIGRWRRWLPMLALAVLLPAAVPNYVAQRGEFAKPSEMDFSDVAAFVGEHAQPGDCVAFAARVSWNPTSARVALNVHPDAFVGLRDVSLGRSALPVGWLWDETLPPDRIADRLVTCDVLWFVTDADRDHPRTIVHTSGEVWHLPAHEFLESSDYAALRSQGFTVAESHPVHMSQVVLLSRP